MGDEVKLDVIKKTQDILGKHIKKPPLTEKLLKKPPFRFLHDIVTSVIRDTGFLDGLFSADELNHENIKDRDGKVAFLDKVISAVKLITNAPLTARATKIVAGHEPTKTNELLQAIGRALDKKMDSSDVVQQLKKKGKKTAHSDTRKTKEETNTTKALKKQSDETDTKAPAIIKSKETNGTKSLKVKKEGSHKKESVSKEKKSKERKQERDAERESALPNNASTELNPSNPPVEVSTSKAEKDIDQKRPQSAVGQRRPSASTDGTRSQSVVPEPESPKLEPVVVNSSATIPADQTMVSSSANAFQQLQSQNEGSQPTVAEANPTPVPPVPLVRPRTAARLGSARPGAPRVRNRGEAAVVAEEPATAPAINVIIDDDSSKKQVDDDNLVIVEAFPPEDATSISAGEATMKTNDSRPPSEQGQLVAQILETQKELEVGNIDGNGDMHRVEIDFEAGRKRERDNTAREVEDMRSLIQTLTRAVHPLGKLLDSLQEDVESMQRELTYWQNMETNVEQQLQAEEDALNNSTQPLKDQLKQLQSAVRSQLDQISVAKANILSNDERIQRLLNTSG